MNSTAHATVFRRLAAFLYDCLLLLALFMLITAIAVRLNDGQATTHIFYKLSLLPFAWFFFAWFWSKGGQTLGMKAWRIKMINLKGGNPSFAKAFLRAIIGPLIVPLWLLMQCLPASAREAWDRLLDSKIVGDKYQLKQ